MFITLLPQTTQEDGGRLCQQPDAVVVLPHKVPTTLTKVNNLHFQS